MTFDPLAQRLAHVASVPAELLAYQSWLQTQRQKQPAQRDYLFSQARARFEPRKDDVVVLAAGLEAVERRGEVALRCGSPAVHVPLPGLSRRVATRILDAIDGRRCLLEVRWRSGVDPDAFGRFLRATFGLVVFAPLAIAQLESRLSGCEVTRFPSAPYAIERAYWENMVEVRAWLQEHIDALEHADRFLALLRSLHVLALMGRSLSSFYKPASPASDLMVSPGGLYLDEPRLLQGEEGLIFLDGPRVNVSLLGGPGYHRALYRSVEDVDALAQDRPVEVEGVSWGRVVLARSERDERASAWFCPPRPVRAEHIEALRRHAVEAMTGDGDDDAAARHAARLHWAFVRLHPFHCANQCLAMNLVNAGLARRLGVGMPHLILDHLALRLTLPAYERVFLRAVGAFAVREGQPSRRLALMQERNAAAFSLIERLSSVMDDQQADELVASSGDAARWALVRGM